MVQDHTIQLLQERDREDWIDHHGDDTLPVFTISRNARSFHRIRAGCHREPDGRHRVIQYDLFAAVLEGLKPCRTCFKDDPFVEVEPS